MWQVFLFDIVFWVPPSPCELNRVPGCDSLTGAHLERYMSPGRCQGALEGQLLQPLGLKKTWNRFVASPALGNKEAEMLGALGGLETQRSIELPRDASASQQGREQNPFWAVSVHLRAGLYSPHWIRVIVCKWISAHCFEMLLLYLGLGGGEGYILCLCVCVGLCAYERWVQIAIVAALFLFVKQGPSLGRGACGGSQPRITLIKALFPQGCAAQMIVNPNKIGSLRNWTLKVICSAW